MRLTQEQIAAHDDQRDLGAVGRRLLVTLLREIFDGVVLDAGGGTGGVSAVLAEVGASPVLLDLSAQMLAASVVGRRVRADLTRLPLADGSVDGVHAAYALQNVDDWRAAVAEVVRVVRPGGPVLVAWGSARPDPLVAALRGHYFAEVAEWAGVAAERAGLTSLDDADAAMAAAGCPLESVRLVAGEQRRSVRALVRRSALNPFQSQPPPDVRRAAVEATLRWAAGQYGDVDAVQAVAVAHEYRLYRKVVD